MSPPSSHRARGGCPHTRQSPVDVSEYLKAGRVRSAGRNVRRGLSRADVEALACHICPWRDHLDDLEPYWVTAKRATRILGVNHTRLNQLAVRGFVPFELHVDGTRLYRRAQLQVVANARVVRWARHRRLLMDQSPDPEIGSP
jgi:hypothetical protein